MGDSDSDKKEFSEALLRFVRNEIKASGKPADYNNEAVEVVDARNHIFKNAGVRGTDESLDIYAIRDLCHVEEESMEIVPDIQRILGIARNYFS